MLNSPFMQTGATKAATKGLLKGSKFSFNGIITNLEKTVSTINQVVPLYNQVRPLISNSKTIINAFKSTKDSSNKKKNRRNTQYQNRTFDPNIINVEVKQPTFDNPIKETKEVSTNDIFTNVDTPNKPFFI